MAPELARILEETPLSADMTLRHGTETARLVATVQDTWQLRWWILSQGAKIEVLKPKRLRREIAGEVAALGKLYGGQKETVS